MKSLSVLLCMAILVACQQSSVKQPVKDTVVVAAPVDTVTYKPDPREVPFERKFSSSSFSSSIFKADSIYGVWTLSNDYPHCGFEINAKRFLYCDYDGNGERFFKIVEDSIFLDGEELYKGHIIKADSDTLIIQWDDGEEDNVNIRWKN